MPKENNNSLRYSVIIPAHNESAYIKYTLDSMVNQTLLPEQLIVANDNSTDDTAEIVKSYQAVYPFITLIHITSSAEHIPGSKVVKAFLKAYESIDESQYDIIVKLDADLILPDNYFETIISHFQADEKLGMAGGYVYIEKNGEWVLENIADKSHVRGVFKAYRKELFLQMGKLKPEIGWDTVDELLALYYGWTIKTDETLMVKHLKPTGAKYNKSARFKQGEAFYLVGYDLWITAIASAKMAWKKKSIINFKDNIMGYLKAKSSKKEPMVNEEQAKFIRNYRWKKIKEKLF